VFGARRMAWGSNYPTSPGTLAEIKVTAEDRLTSLSAEDRSWIFGRTAQTLYPNLSDND
jgi:L-fuconolactonase